MLLIINWILNTRIVALKINCLRWQDHLFIYLKKLITYDFETGTVENQMDSMDSAAKVLFVTKLDKKSQRVDKRLFYGSILFKITALLNL
jgi:hypothetical protein